ncbi:hypothetical protein ANN_18932 [Periplaneta americana]|uniref:THAP-type domain-containing protein n=1 Tax=Periplaneta americana TaxID=6978 RepID=A0ABQ8SQ49_PERAM|nr:hypothetical protein ANN_18932 [Periplaneta americana]
MSPGSSTESYPAFAHIGFRENPGKNLNQVTCPDRVSNPGHLVSRPDALAVTPQINIPGCAAVGCSNSAKKGMLMKRFPKDPARRKEWHIKMKRDKWKPTDYSYLCEVHFAPDMWEKTRIDGTRKLKSNAVPTIFFFSPPSAMKRKPPIKRKASASKATKSSSSPIPVLKWFHKIWKFLLAVVLNYNRLHHMQHHLVKFQLLSLLHQVRTVTTAVRLNKHT